MTVAEDKAWEDVGGYGFVPPKEHIESQDFQGIHSMAMYPESVENPNYKAEYKEYTENLAKAQILQKEKLNTNEEYQHDRKEARKMGEKIKQYEHLESSIVPVPEWSDIYTKFKELEPTTNRKELGVLKNQIEDINANEDYTPDEKIQKFTEVLLGQYRNILRSGLTGLLAGNTGSRLGEALRDFAKNNLDIELPTSLKKGLPLDIESLKNAGKVGEKLEIIMEKVSSENQQQEESRDFINH